jgi:hypothetical protein
MSLSTLSGRATSSPEGAEMINYSRYPAPHVRIGYDKVGRAWFLRFLTTLKGVPSPLDASRGKLRSAMKSMFTKLYVTSDLYMDYNISGSVQFFNVRTGGQDYRIVLGYDHRIVRVETLDAKVAESRTRSEAAYWARQNQPPAPEAPAATEDEPFYNAEVTDEEEENQYQRSPVLPGQPPAESPYGVRIAANQ